MPKTSPLRTSLVPACLNDYLIIIFSGCYEVDESMNKCETLGRFRICHILHPRLIEGRPGRGLAEASPKQNILAQRQREAHGYSKL